MMEGVGFGMMIMMIVFWGAHYCRRGRGIRRLVVREESRPYSALEILRQKYTRGEINKKEFESRKGT